MYIFIYKCNYIKLTYYDILIFVSGRHAILVKYSLTLLVSATNLYTNNMTYNYLSICYGY